MKQLKNRMEAGQQLAAQLQAYANDPDILVLALPRGGVPVAFEIARSLHAPLDVFLVRKLGVPGHEELAMGAISSGGDRVLNKEIIEALQLSDSTVERITAREQDEMKKREDLYRRNRPPLEISGKSVILVDDGLATGSTMLAAIRAVQKMKAARIIIAVPVAPVSTYESMKKLGDDMHCLMTPEPFYGVGLWYEDFTQTTDDEVIHLLGEAERWRKVPVSQSSPDDDGPGFQRVSIPAGQVELPGKLLLHEGSPRGIVMLVHGAGYPGQSPQHDRIARHLHETGFSTVSFNLLTRDEESSEIRSRHLRFDIPLLTKRLNQATDWVIHELATEDQPLGFFGSSTATAAVLRAASVMGRQIKAIVSLSGRPDLAGDVLSKVTAPTLLVMGGQDISIMDLNVCARSRMRPGLVRVEVVPQASHLFEEDGAFERAANLTSRWFERHLYEHELSESSHYAQSMRLGDGTRMNDYGLFA
jgi:putative phosphoribosyl transferase